MSTCLPLKKRVKNDKPQHILNQTLEVTNEQFLQENGELVKKSKFQEFRPENVKLQGAHHWNQCLCPYCVNVELKLSSLHKANVLLEHKNKYDLVNYV